MKVVHFSIVNLSSKTLADVGNEIVSIMYTSLALMYSSNIEYGPYHKQHNTDQGQGGVTVTMTSRTMSIICMCDAGKLRPGPMSSLP
jgi:hypothetical protein